MRRARHPDSVLARVARAGLLVATVLVACVLLAGTAGTARGAEKAIWGPLTLPGGESAFPTYRDLGLDTLQVQLDWRATAPTRPANPADPADPAYRWPAAIDRAVSEGAANGIAIALLVQSSPGWANGGRSAIDAPDPTEYATFLAAASRRYPAVRRWMIWGEPNRDDRFQPNAEGSAAGPQAYAPILDAAYEALKRVSPQNIVIGGMTWTGGTVKPAPFLQMMRLSNGRPPRLDWFGHNPYPFRFPNLKELSIEGGWRDISDMDTFTQELQGIYGSNARFWLSEFTILSDMPSAEFTSFVSRQAQAQWLTAGFKIADALPSIAGLAWFTLLDQPERAGGSHTGLLTADGARKPAYQAFRQAPSVRFRPGVRAARKVARRAVLRRGLRVLVRPKVAGPIVVELRTRGGWRVRRASRAGAAGRLWAVKLRRGRLRRGRYNVLVRAPRGEAVRRTVTVR